MDSFTCGTCRETFHSLEDFALHKQAHNPHLTSITRNSSQDENVMECVVSGTSSSTLSTTLTSSSNTEDSNPSNAVSTQIRKFQSYSLISQSKRLSTTASSTLKTSDASERTFSISHSNPIKCHSSPKHLISGGMKNGEDYGSSSSGLRTSVSKEFGYSITSGGLVPSLGSESKTAEPNCLMSPVPHKLQELSKGVYGQGQEKSLPGHQGNKVELPRPVTASLDDGAQTYQDGESSIQIFESGSSEEAVLLGQLILEDDVKEVVRIEITEIPENGNTVESASFLDDCNVSNIQEVDFDCVSDVLDAQTKEKKCITSQVLDFAGREENRKSRPKYLSDIDKLNLIAKSKDDTEIMEKIPNEMKSEDNKIDGINRNQKTVHQILSINRRDLPQNSSESINQTSFDPEGKAVVDDYECHHDSAINIKNSTKDCETGSSGAGERIHINIKEIPNAEEPANQNINQIVVGLNAKEKKDEERFITIDEEGAALSHVGCEASVVADEGVDLVHSNLVSNNSEVTDVTYASAPGLYTLLLNADNTFTLVAGGYQGSTSGQNNRIYVCHHCKKFALSQVEILNHISLCHPDDLEDVNRCVAEFSSLTTSSCENDGDAGQLLLSANASSAKLIVGVPEEKSILETPCNQMNQDSVVIGYDPRRTVKKRLGRPRKEELRKAEDQKNCDSEEKRSFIKEGNGFLCTNCQKFFPKHRQFDKHKCHMWKTSFHPSDTAGNSAYLSGGGRGGGGTEEYSPHDDVEADFNYSFLEDDLEEEWKVNKRYKPKVKIKGREDDRRKRGRPPKVDVMASKTTACNVTQENRGKIDEGSLTPSLASNTSYKDSAPHLMSAVSPALPSGSSGGANPPLLNSIPTLPVFSNAQQQERLHKWIAQIDLSFVDSIIDKLCPGEGGASHQGVEMYMCRECKVIFRSLLACRRHCAKHMTRKAFTCPDCDFATTNVGGLYSHYRNHTQNLYACSKCDFRARIKAHFRDHLETHNPNRYVCHLCQRPYSTSNSLRSHIYLYHPNEEGMKYLWCLRKKNQDRNTTNVFFQCPICSKLFGERSAANRHLATHGPSVPEVFVKCEVCNAETLIPDTLKKHMQKHKVVYICCVCHKPQVTASCLRSHQKVGQCVAPQPESFKQSLLLSFTSPETFPGLLSNKRIGPLLQDKVNHPLEENNFAEAKMSDALIKQMEEAGYKQIYQLLRDKVEVKSGGNAMEHTVGDIMKIVVDTRYAEENEQFVSWEQQETQEEHVEYHDGVLLEQACYQETAVESQNCESGERVIFPSRQSEDQYVASDGNKIGQSRADTSPVHLPDQDPTSGVSDQRVVVISNVGEEQTVVVEDGQMMMMEEEERFVIINDESVGKQPISFAKFFVDNN